MTRLIYKNSVFEVLSRIINNSFAENSVNVCKACDVQKSLVKNLGFFAVQARIKNTNQLIKNLSRLPRTNLNSFLRVSTVVGKNTCSSFVA